VSADLAAGAARLGLAALAITFALAATSGSSVAQDSARPAAAPAAASAADAAQLAKGRQLFADYGCGSCHSLADAGATGHVGPSFDGDSNLTPAFVTDRVTNGQGAMPAFGGQLSPQDIAALATYVTHAAAN
jgi:mono/diheme cytochrome c family protein